MLAVHPSDERAAPTQQLSEETSRGRNDEHAVVGKTFDHDDKFRRVVVGKTFDLHDEFELQTRELPEQQYKHHEQKANQKPTASCQKLASEPRSTRLLP